MDALSSSYFVVAATVSAELFKAMQVASKISLTASNARALALRAGQGAAGFRAITDFIDELAITTVNASKSINAQATHLSRTACEAARAEDALKRFEIVYRKAKHSQYLSTLDQTFERTKTNHKKIKATYKKQLHILQSELDGLAKALRTATVLSAISRVEASRTGPEFEQHLIVVAQNVVDAAEKIRDRVKRSQALFSSLNTHSSSSLH